MILIGPHIIPKLARAVLVKVDLSVQVIMALHILRSGHFGPAPHRSSLERTFLAKLDLSVQVMMALHILRLVLMNSGARLLLMDCGAAPHRSPKLARVKVDLSVQMTMALHILRLGLMEVGAALAVRAPEMRAIDK